MNRRNSGHLMRRDNPALNPLFIEGGIAMMEKGNRVREISNIGIIFRDSFLSTGYI